MNSVHEALALLATEGVLTLVPVEGFRSLVAEIAGGPVRGSWWGHPRGKVIYRIATELEASGEALVGKIVAGKVAFVHRSLWPAWLRIVTDAAWRRGRLAGVGAEARSLWDEVQARGRVRLEGKAKDQEKARKVLETRLLVLGTSEHTEKGSHAPVLQAWEAWAAGAAKVKREAARLSWDEAKAALEAVGIVVAAGVAEVAAGGARKPTKRGGTRAVRGK